ncbi:MAG: matrixin family metalloprotease, partial [Candidatus Binatia bacterium]
ELGHFAGLGHSSHPEATMFAASSPGETRKRSPEDDDRAGLATLYGSSAGTAGGLHTAIEAGAGSGGGCSIARTRRASPDELGWLVALLLATALRRLPHPRRGSDLRAPGSPRGSPPAERTPAPVVGIRTPSQGTGPGRSAALRRGS